MQKVNKQQQQQKNWQIIKVVDNELKPSKANVFGICMMDR